MIINGEIRCWSLLGFKELRVMVLYAKLFVRDPKKKKVTAVSRLSSTTKFTQGSNFFSLKSNCFKFFFCLFVFGHKNTSAMVTTFLQQQSTIHKNVRMINTKRLVTSLATSCSLFRYFSSRDMALFSYLKKWRNRKYVWRPYHEQNGIKKFIPNVACLGHLPPDGLFKKAQLGALQVGYFKCIHTKRKKNFQPTHQKMKS